MDRSKENINKLLEKYWAGESSLDEERELRVYFHSGNVDTDLQVYAPLFELHITEHEMSIDITDEVISKIASIENESDEIKSILEKYWAGESTLDEEQKIYSYFKKGNVAGALKTYAPVFDYLEDERNLSIDVSDEVMNKISDKRKVIPIKIETKLFSINWQKAVAIAASLLLVITLGINTYQKQVQAKELKYDTFQTPEEALEQTKAALAYLSARMNKGTEKATESMSKTESLEIFNQ